MVASISYDMFSVLTFTIVSAGNDCFVPVACKYNKIFLFFVTKGNLTLLFSQVSNFN